MLVIKDIYLAYRDRGCASRITADSHRRYFLSRVKIGNYNIKIDVRHFYDQPINDLTKQYDEVRKVSRWKGEDYTTGCLLDFDYFKNNHRLTATDLSKQKALYADSRAIQQLFLLVGQIQVQWFITFSNNQKKLC